MSTIRVNLAVTKPNFSLKMQKCIYYYEGWIILTLLSGE